VLLGVGGLYDDIIYVNFHCSAEEWVKNSIHEALVRCACVLEAKGHDLIEKVGRLGDESGFKLVLIGHRYLIVAGIGIQETKYCVPRSPID